MNYNFKLYSDYYDLLYQDKDYESEAGYINTHIRSLLPEASSLLELGCGTGNHARFLTQHGFKITGIERSKEMVELAKKKSIPEFNPTIADISDFDLPFQFDAAVSLFHSICYLTSNEQLINAFTNVSRYLKAGGIFAFDFWYAPAVLHHLPRPKTKFQQNETVMVTRNGETSMFIDDNVAEVNYDIVVTEKSSGKFITISEKHPMRYFSIPEITLIARMTGFSVISFEEFLTKVPPTLESWSVFIVLQKLANQETEH